MSWIDWSEVRYSLHRWKWKLTPGWRKDQIIAIREANRIYTRTLNKLRHAILEDRLANMGPGPGRWGLTVEVLMYRAEEEMRATMDQLFFGPGTGSFKGLGIVDTMKDRTQPEGRQAVWKVKP